jgi:DNA-binding SARP family transcriptional activator
MESDSGFAIIPRLANGASAERLSIVNADDRAVVFGERAKTSGTLAKLNRPKLFGALPRERLFSMLDQHRAHPVVWVGGPPGVGKTTLVASYLEKRQLRGYWYQVDSGDADPATFFYYLGLGAGDAASAKGKPLPMLTPEYLSDLAGFSRRFFRELFNRLPRPGVLVLDNCQGVADDAKVHSLLVDSIQEIPEGINVIFISRGEPPSVYARLLANQTVALFDSRKLQLTFEETRAIASATLSADDALVDTLYRQSEGWAAGLTLMLERVRRNGITPGHLEAETREAVFNYFAGEILDRAAPEDRQILISTAFLPRMTPAMAEQVSGSPRAGKLLQQLYRRQLFISRRAGAPPTYQYHDLFRQFLLARAEETYAQPDLKQFANRAAALLEETDQLEEAVGLYLLTKDWNAASHLILRQGACLLAQGRGQTLREWVSALPSEHVASAPWLAYWYGMSLIQIDQPAARAELESALVAFERMGDESGQMVTAAGIIESYQHEWSTFAPMDRWIDVLDALLARNARFPSQEAELRVYSALLIALFRSRPERHRLFSICTERLTALLDAQIDVNPRIVAAGILLMIHFWNLEVDAGRDLMRRLEVLLRHRDARALARVFGMNRLAFALWLGLEHEEAARVLDEAVSLADGNGLTATEAFLFFGRHQLAMGRGDRAAIESNIQKLKPILNPSRRLGQSVLLRAMTDHTLLQGNAAAAVALGKDAVSVVDEAATRPMQAIWRFSLAAALAEDRKHQDALACLDEARALIRGTAFAKLLRDCDFLGAYVALAHGDRPSCHRLLTEALAAWQHEGEGSHVFILYPGCMAQVCGEALRAGIAVDQARALITRYRLAPPAASDDAWPWPIRIRALGKFIVVKDGVEVSFGRKTQKRPLDLLQALIALGGVDVPVNALTEALWPDAEGDAAYHSFENTLYRLRQLLGPESVLVLAGGKLSLDTKRCWVDVWAFEQLSAQARADTGEMESNLQCLLELYRGHFLAHEPDKPWALGSRESLREKFLLHIRAMAKSHEAARRWEQAAAIYQRGIELDNLAESLYRGLMVCQRELGNYAEALKVYRRVRELLSVVLGVQPTAETQAVYQQLKMAESTPSEG